MKHKKTSPVKYWSGTPLTENDIIGWAESTGFGSEGAMPHKSRRVSDAIAHLKNLGHKITVTHETVAEPSNEKS